jgi:hypothetical protein
MNALTARTLIDSALQTRTPADSALRNRTTVALESAQDLPRAGRSRLRAWWAGRRDHAGARTGPK